MSHKLTQPQWEDVYAQAQKSGLEAGETLAEWYWQDSFGSRGRGSVDDARRVLAGIDDGDPEIMGTMPSVDFSGQWADGPDWNSTFSEVVWDATHIDDVEQDDEYDAGSDDCFLVFTNAADSAALEMISGWLRDLIEHDSNPA